MNKIHCKLNWIGVLFGGIWGSLQDWGSSGNLNVGLWASSFLERKLMIVDFFLAHFQTKTNHLSFTGLLFSKRKTNLDNTYKCKENIKGGN